MKVFFVFDIKKGASGGGNQFLKALKLYWEKTGNVVETPESADVILFNSYQYVKELIDIFKKYPNKIYVHRIDGPIRLYNKMSDKRDLVTNIVNKYIANGTIFQSDWSREANYNLGLAKKKFEMTFINAPNPEVFFKKEYSFNKERKIKLIATSWSNNIKKGFNDYKWLDENLDFNKYDFTFIGQTPIDFKNIKVYGPMTSEELANKIREADIFLTASINDPCSNSLIEALHCGLPSIGKNSGGHPSIIKKGGKVFDNANEIPALLEEIVNNYSEFVAKIEMASLDEVQSTYFSFLEKLNNEDSLKSKKGNFWSNFVIKSVLFYWKLSDKFGR